MIDEWTLKTRAMDTQNVSEAHIEGICPADNEQCLKVSRGLEIRWMGPRNERPGLPGPGPLSSQHQRWV